LSFDGAKVGLLFETTKQKTNYFQEKAKIFYFSFVFRVFRAFHTLLYICVCELMARPERCHGTRRHAGTWHALNDATAPDGMRAHGTP
jgi:hypothetical protein